MRRQRTIAQLDAQVKRWNDAHPVGAPVFYHPVIGEPAGRYSNTRSLAFVLSGHTACVFIEHESGCVALDALEAL